MRRLSWLLLLIALAFGLVLLAQRADHDAHARPAQPTAAQPAQAPPAREANVKTPGAPPPNETGPLRYIAVGGGSFPESSEVSLEQNLALAKEVLAGPGSLLFAGGSDSLAVRVEGADEGSADSLLVRLGDLFQPRAGRRSRYRAPRLPARSADAQSVEAELVRALSSGGTAPALHGGAAIGREPLLVYFATHGDQGQREADNRIVLWGGTSLTPARVVELHDAHPRPLRLLVASCFSGGFAEIAFEHADSRAGAAQASRCGLFAGTWDRETSGCDPDPERRNQEGYSLHVLQALRRRDREGAALPLRDIDYDGDGRVSLLEAHAWASIAGQSIDVPTTTSERYLRAVQTRAGKPDVADLPELAAVVQRLQARLGVHGEAAARKTWQALDERLAALDERVAGGQEEADARYGELAARLLARWPVLDDPYHPDFNAMLARDRDAIEQLLGHSAETERYRAADEALAELEAQRDALEAQEAAVLRLVRAHETLSLAGGLRARGGRAWESYARLLACERFAPELAAP